jgi:hypothetical protein
VQKNIFGKNIFGENIGTKKPGLSRLDNPGFFDKLNIKPLYIRPGHCRDHSRHEPLRAAQGSASN